MTTDFKRDLSTGELITEGGLQLITTNEELAAQRLTLAIGLNLGEWFLDISYGLPWIKDPDLDFDTNVRYLLGSSLPQPELFIKNTLDSFIKNQSYISSITSSYEYSKSDRFFHYTVKAVIDTGEEITLTPYKVNI